MSILIKNMEMPTEGEYNMTLYVFSDGSAYMDVASLPVDNDKFEVVPVPPHGRLIDANALKPYMLNEHYKYRLVYDANEVANAPTIIPAEPTKEENFCADCAWYEAEEMYCFRQGNHSYDAGNCVLWEPKAEPPKE